MTRQEMFDTAAKGVIKQGRAAMDYSTGICWYRDPQDPSCRCNAGHLIPDDLYTANMEKRSMWQLHRDPRTQSFPWDSALDGPFVGSLQGVHDDAEVMTKDEPSRFIELYKTRMAIFAIRYDLSPAVLGQPAT